MDVHIDMYMDVHIDICVDVHIDQRIDMCVHMHIDVCVHMCVDVHMDMHGRNAENRMMGQVLHIVVELSPRRSTKHVHACAIWP